MTGVTGTGGSVEGGPGFAAAERSALADLLAELGSEAPTMCAGWQTGDLVAHLVVRENQPVAASGIVVPALAGKTRHAMQELRDRYTHAHLVDRFRSGPSARWAPTRLSAVDRAANTVEFFIHHEDVRRAQPDWRPRTLPAVFEAYLWRRLSKAGKLMFRRSAVGVLLTWPDTATARVRKGEPTAVLEGAPSELTLYASGRQSVARVRLAGPPAATEALSQAHLGY